jgi:two-component system phosphate regulon sensor histidine kinase PhoR
MINTVLETYRLKCEQLDGSITFIHPPKAIIHGDETHLVNCVCNLLDNAVKYRRDIPLIEILLAESPDSFGLSITDNGIGMNAETQQYIFEKFYRAHTGVRHDTKGFGLGLSYVKGIVETHGGKVAVESKKGVGTRFIIHLPKYAGNGGD